MGPDGALAFLNELQSVPMFSFFLVFLSVLTWHPLSCIELCSKIDGCRSEGGGELGERDAEEVWRHIEFSILKNSPRLSYRDNCVSRKHHTDMRWRERRILLHYGSCIDCLSVAGCRCHAQSVRNEYMFEI